MHFRSRNRLLEIKTPEAQIIVLFDKQLRHSAALPDFHDKILYAFLGNLPISVFIEICVENQIKAIERYRVIPLERNALRKAIL